MRQNLIKDDRHVGFEVLGGFATGLIELVDDVNRGGQTLLGLGFGHELADDLDALEDDSLTGAGDMGEEAMLNRVVLGAVRRIMSDSDLDADVINERLEVLLEEIVMRIVTAAAIAQQQEGGGVWVVELSLVEPPVAQTVTSKLTRIAAGAQIEEAYVVL